VRPEEIVVASAEAAADTVGTAEFAKLTRYALNLMGAEMARHVNTTDHPGVLSPVDVVQDGRDRTGAILVLADRAIIAWTVGMVRIENFEAVVPHRSIQRVERRARPAGAMSKEREVLLIKAARTWTLVFANVFERGRSVVPFLAGFIEGWLRPVYEGEEPDAGDAGSRARERATLLLLDHE
jgi:hypothetical protein